MRTYKGRKTHRKTWGHRETGTDTERWGYIAMETQRKGHRDGDTDKPCGDTEKQAPT